MDKRILNKQPSKKIFLVSRCSWTLYNFRSGLIRALLKKNANVTGAGSLGDGYDIEINALGANFKGIPIDKKGINPLTDIKLTLDLYRWYKKEKPNIVHHFTIKPVIYGSIAARLAGINQVVNTITGMGYVFVEKKAKLLRRVVKLLYRISLKCAHYTFFQNQDDLNYFTGYGLIDKEKAGLLPGSGVDCVYFSPIKIPIEQNEKTSRVLVLMVSRLLKDKGVYEFIQSARLVKKTFPHAQFQLLGRRDTRNPNVISEIELNTWINQGIVSWLGEVKDVRPIIAKADIVVLPSYREGTPRALLEASAMSKPIITTNAVGCRDVVDDQITGLIVPVKNSKALADAILKIIGDFDLRLSMGKAGRTKMKAEFDENIIIDKIFKIYSYR